MSDRLSPMLANAIDVEKVPTNYVMEPKLDGVRCLVQVMPHGAEIWTRTGHLLTDKLPSLCKDLVRVFSGEEIVLDAEVGYWKHRPLVMDFNSTMRVIGSGTEEAIRKQTDRTDGISLCVFDMLFNKGFTTDEPLTKRRLRLQELFDSHLHGRTISLVPQLQAYDERYMRNIVELGGEGVMLKNPDAPYVLGKRPAKHWYKIKSFRTADVVITGFIPGQGKYADQVGALILSAWDVQTDSLLVVGKCSGFDDARRLDMTVNWDNYRGKTVEIKYFGRVGIGEDGLRHPQFVRMRPDKAPTFCTIQEL